MRTFLAIEWLRGQPWSTRLFLSAGFASVSVFAYFMGRIWPWGYVMAVVPLVLPRTSKVEEEFFRPVKPTDEAPAVMERREVAMAALETTLGKLAAATSTGLTAEKIAAVIEGATALQKNQSRRFNYVVIFAGRPTSLQLTVLKKNAEMLELQVMSDPKLVGFVKND